MGILGVVVWLAFGVPIAVLGTIWGSPFLIVVSIAIAAVLYSVHVQREEKQRARQASFFPDGKIRY